LFLSGKCSELTSEQGVGGSAAGCCPEEKVCTDERLGDSCASENVSWGSGKVV